MAPWTKNGFDSSDCGGMSMQISALSPLVGMRSILRPAAGGIDVLVQDAKVARACAAVTRNNSLDLADHLLRQEPSLPLPR